MPFEFGDVVLVPFPFTSQRASKKRPAVVVSNRRGYSSPPWHVPPGIFSVEPCDEGYDKGGHREIPD